MVGQLCVRIQPGSGWQRCIVKPAADAATALLCLMNSSNAASFCAASQCYFVCCHLLLYHGTGDCSIHSTHQWDMSVPAAARMGSVKLPGCSCGPVRPHTYVSQLLTLLNGQLPHSSAWSTEFLPCSNMLLLQSATDMNASECFAPRHRVCCYHPRPPVSAG
jgi:hypothetical protein